MLGAIFVISQQITLVAAKNTTVFTNRSTKFSLSYLNAVYAIAMPEKAFRTYLIPTPPLKNRTNKTSKKIAATNKSICLLLQLYFIIITNKQTPKIKYLLNSRPITNVIPASCHTSKKYIKQY